jgi:hypothetical protein
VFDNQAGAHIYIGGKTVVLKRCTHTLFTFVHGFGQILKIWFFSGDFWVKKRFFLSSNNNCNKAKESIL